MSDREESPDRIDNGGSPEGDDHQSNRSNSRQGSDRDGSENGHSPRPAGRSRSRSQSNSRRHSRSRKSRSRSSDRKKHSSRHSPSGEKRTKRSRSPMSSRRRHVGNRDNPPEGRCLGIFGLSIYTQERDIKEVFSKYGPLEDVQIVYDAQTGRSRGFSFVYFEDKNDAAEAKERCNGIDIGGRKIRVDFSITQRAHTPTPGIYMGKPTHPRYRSGGDSRGGDSRGGSGGGGSRGYDRGGRSYDRRRSPSPYRRGARYSRSRSRSHSPRSRHYR